MAWYDKYYDENGYEIGGVMLPAKSWFGPISDEEAEKKYKEMARLEAAGAFDDLFKGECVEHRVLPTKEKLLDSIKSDMKLFKSTFIKIYGYELTWPGFMEEALLKLEKAGCNKAREYYQRFVSEYEQEHEKAMKNVAEWYRKQDYEKKEVRDCKENLMNMSNSNLLQFLVNLTEEG